MVESPTKSTIACFQFSMLLCLEKMRASWFMDQQVFYLTKFNPMISKYYLYLHIFFGFELHCKTILKFVV